MASLSVQSLLQTAFARGIKNIVPLVVNALLWLVTVWIPYINIGTTIGLYVGVIAKMARGEAISPVEIFDSDYRKYMGGYFLVTGLMMAGVSFAFMLFIVPGIILGIAWLIAPLLVVDQALNPMEALQKSNELTWGNKAKIFLAQLLLGVAIFILYWIAGLIGEAVAALGTLLTIIVALVAVSATIALNSAIYGDLTGITGGSDSSQA